MENSDDAAEREVHTTGPDGLDLIADPTARFPGSAARPGLPCEVIVMKLKMLDPVVLERDLPDHGLRPGDLGTVVEVHEPDGIEVEFLTASGDTEAVLTLTVADVRRADRNDLISVRKLRRSA